MNDSVLLLEHTRHSRVNELKLQISQRITTQFEPSELVQYDFKRVDNDFITSK